MQNKKRMVVRNPSTPVAIALVRIPLPAMTLFKTVCRFKKKKKKKD